MRSILVLITVVTLLVCCWPSGATAVRCQRPTATKWALLPAEWPGFYRALRREFGPEWRDAATVSYGESTWHPDAKNGQYLGYFQMGSNERARTGWTSDTDGQVRAARRWNDMTHGHWGAWDCRP